MKHNNHDYIDLGLPSGTLWATCNVGANSPEEYGDYYAWGETTAPKDSYYWNTYKWCAGSETILTKYCNDANYGNNGFTDGKTTLDPEDDAAAVNWGSRWRMPTHDDWVELRDNCTWTWTTLNGVNGYEVKSKANGNSIFLPAAGYRRFDYLNDAGYCGYFWSSSLYADYPYNAWSVYFDSDYVDRYYDNCYLGLSVRPVCVKKIKKQKL